MKSRSPSEAGDPSAQPPPSGEEAPSGEEPRSVEEALQQALAHTRAAACEGLLAARCLLDAASLALYGEPAARAGDGAGEARLALVAMAHGLDELATLARGQTAASVPDGVMQALLGALDAEIGRWEQRSREDRDARGVLRAFLGLREILWELGVRATDSQPPEAPTAEPDSGTVHWQGSEERIVAALRRATPAGATRPSADTAPRVQRVEVRG